MINDTSVIIAAAGSASRMDGIDKQLAEICGKSVIRHSAEAFCACDSVAEIVVVTREDIVEEIRRQLSDLQKVKAVIIGGKTRQESVFCALKHISKETLYISVHDGARPLILPETIEKNIADARVFGAAAVGVPVKDTIKTVDDMLIVDTPDRSRMYSIQTPQTFRRAVYFEGAAFAGSHGLDFTDDCQLVEAINVKIAVTLGKYSNIKITTPDDLKIAAVL